VKAHTLCLRRAAINGNRVDVTLLMLNASQQDCEFLYPPPELHWIVKADSAEPEGEPITMKDNRMVVGAHGAVLCAAEIKR
jgi:hypothetical protein